MRRTAARRSGGAVTAAVLALTVLAGCSGPSPYCEAVEKGQSTLDNFGAKRTDSAFGGYARMLTSISKEAPSPIKKDWTTLAEATQGVIAAHEEVGFKLEDMGDEDKRSSLSESDIETLNQAYDAFNDTTDARKAVVADVADTCDIELT